MSDIKKQIGQKLKGLKGAGANKALLGDTQKWLGGLLKRKVK